MFPLFIVAFRLEYHISVNYTEIYLLKSIISILEVINQFGFLYITVRVL